MRQIVHVDMATAFNLLRAHARNNNLQLTVVAAQVIAETLALDGRGAVGAAVPDIVSNSTAARFSTPPDANMLAPCLIPD